MMHAVELNNCMMSLSNCNNSIYYNQCWFSAVVDKDPELFRSEETNWPKGPVQLPSLSVVQWLTESSDMIVVYSEVLF